MIAIKVFTGTVLVMWWGMSIFQMTSIYANHERMAWVGFPFLMGASAAFAQWVTT